ncbi:hypothetical protein EDB85DRAFT_2207832 [Lactarius pseudohatsudake]|nr:hypothetical protein EDB85DRAFT_2207832 [Lactarius pseudohatsudake]
MASDAPPPLRIQIRLVNHPHGRQLPPDLLLLRFPGPNLGHPEPRARLQPDTEPDARPHRGYFTLGLSLSGRPVFVSVAIRAPLSSPQHARSELRLVLLAFINIPVIAVAFVNWSCLKPIATSGSLPRHTTYRNGIPPPDHEIAHILISLLIAGQTLRQPTDELKSLPVLDSIIRETLRMHHQSTASYGADLIGHYVLACPAVSQVDKSLWFKPEEWIPSRWTNSEGQAQQAFEQYAVENGEKVDYGFGALGTLISTVDRNVEMRILTRVPPPNYHTMISTLPKQPGSDHRKHEGKFSQAHFLELGCVLHPSIQDRRLFLFPSGIGGSGTRLVALALGPFVRKYTAMGIPALVLLLRKNILSQAAPPPPASATVTVLNWTLPVLR